MDNMDTKKNAQSGNEKTFTQEEVNQIVQERLARERKNNPDLALLEDREKELAKREKAFEVKERLKKNNWPDKFAVFLENAEDIDAVERQLKEGLASYDRGGKTPYTPRRGSDPRGEEEDIRRKFGLYD